MLQNNRPLWRSLLAMTALTLTATGVGFGISVPCGALMLGCGLALTAIHLAVELSRCRTLAKLNRELDRLLVSGTPLPIREYQEGELSILSSQIHKITLRLRDAAEASRADKRLLADSLADISHQLRTPLTAMNLTAAMLRDPELTASQRISLTGELDRLLRRVDWLVETLLKLSKLDAGTVKLAREPVPARALIRRAVEPLAIPMDLRGQQLHIRCAEESFTGDLVWTAEALGNILKNCMEHTPQGGSITLTASETPLFTQFTLEDTGPGFAVQDLPHLFERFYKGAQAGHSGYGIGLALARTVITAQNGTVQAMNGPQGAKFVIKFYKQII